MSKTYLKVNNDGELEALVIAPEDSKTLAEILACCSERNREVEVVVLDVDTAGKLCYNLSKSAAEAAA